MFAPRIWLGGDPAAWPVIREIASAKSCKRHTVKREKHAPKSLSFLPGIDEWRTRLASQKRSFDEKAVHQKRG